MAYKHNFLKYLLLNFNEKISIVSPLQIFRELIYI